MTNAKTSVGNFTECPVPGMYRGSASPSQNYSGYIVPVADSNDTAYTEADSQWVVPTVGANGNYSVAGCTSRTSISPIESEWVGVGNQEIFQAGTDSCAASTPHYTFWYEDFDGYDVQNGGEPYYTAGLPVTGGDTVDVSAVYVGNGMCQYYYENQTAGTHETEQPHKCPATDFAQADFILEHVIDGASYMPRFSTFQVGSNDYYNSSGTEKLLENHARDEYYIEASDNSGQIAHPTDVTSPNSVFSQVFDKNGPVY